MPLLIQFQLWQSDREWPKSMSKSWRESRAATASAREDTCPWCGYQLINLFAVDLTDARLSFLAMSGEHFSVATCYRCGTFGPIFSELLPDGTARWSALNTPPAYLPDDYDDWEQLPEDMLVLAPAPHHPCRAASESLHTTFSQLGGLPTWTGGCLEYPACPTCRQTMHFLGQLSALDIAEYCDGIYYAFLCPTCRLACTSYLQS